AKGIDLEPFYDLMRDPSLLKVFHSARQDIEIFVLKMGEVPKPLFDTQVAAMVCGFGESAGYETLVTRFAGARLDKAVRFTDWTKRPLSPRQLDYALSDVTHLRTVYDKLRAMLEKNNRESWLEEEMAVLTDVETYRLNPEDAWKRLKPRSRNPRFLAAVRSLAIWREKEAQRRDLPRNRVMRDEVLLEVAAHMPQDAESLGNLRGVPKGYAKGPEAKGILAAIHEAASLPEDQLPPIPAQDDQRGQNAGPAADILKLLLKVKCLEAGVAPKLVASSQDVEDIAIHGADADVPALHGWRFDLFGRDALALRDGRLGVALKGNRLKLFDIDEDGQAVMRSRPRRGGRRPAPEPQDAE
ncbi:MAG TPA: ribonuclease D, partial [Sphingomonadales bacterium]